MRVRVVTPPAPVLTWEEADAHLKLDGDVDQKAFVEGLIAAATQHLDGPDGWLGRALGPQTLEGRLDGFLGHAYRLPYPPLINVLSVKFRDTAGVIQTIDPALYEVDGVDLAPIHGGVWPDAPRGRGTVRIQWRAGYAADAAANPLVPAVPQVIKSAILLMVGDLYRYRETVTAGSVSAVPMSTTVENLLTPLRAFG